jgi:hypothetical protein
MIIVSPLVASSRMAHVLKRRPGIRVAMKIIAGSYRPTADFGER